MLPFPLLKSGMHMLKEAIGHSKILVKEQYCYKEDKKIWTSWIRLQDIQWITRLIWHKIGEAKSSYKLSPLIVSLRYVSGLKIHNFTNYYITDASRIDASDNWNIKTKKKSQEQEASIKAPECMYSRIAKTGVSHSIKYPCFIEDYEVQTNQYYIPRIFKELKQSPWRWFTSLTVN